MRGIGVLVLLLAAAWSLNRADASEKIVARSPAELFRARCSACHDPSRTNHRRASRDGWREIVNRMQRMPQSGITPAEAGIIIDYLAGRDARTSTKASAPKGRVGGRKAYGKDWLAVLEIATVRNGKVVIGGRTYAAAREGLQVSLKRGKRIRTVSLTPEGRGGETAVSDRWRVGTVTYELHLVLYEVHGDTIRIGRALKRS